MLDTIRDVPPGDLDEYFDRNPGFLDALVSSLKLIDVNNETLRIYGARSKDDIFREFGKHRLPEIYTVFRRLAASYLSGVTLLRLETVNETLDGRRIDIIEQIALTEESKKTGQIFFSVIDITDRKRAEEALYHREAFNFALFEYNPAETIVVDREGKITMFNLVKKKSGNRLPSIGEVMYKNYAGKHGIDMFGEMMECIEKNEVKKFSEMKYRDKFLSITISPFPEGAIIISENITERIRAEEKLLSYQKQLRSMASELSKSEEHDRRKIATYLHDRIGQALVVTRMKFGALKESNDKKETDRLIHEINNLLGHTIEETRSLTFELSPPILYELGFEPAIEWLCEKISEEHSLHVEFKNDRHPKPVSDDVGALFFRAMSELLTNVVKHSQAQSARVNIRRKDDFVHITIQDDGIGFDTSEMHAPTWLTSKFGLFSIRERIESVDGSITIESEPGHGTCIELTVPIKGDETSTKGSAT